MKYKIDIKIMDNIDTEEKAYWLGFFYADAYNNEKCGRIVIELSTEDKDHLIKCARFFGQPRDPFLQKKNGGKYIAYRLELNGKHLSQSLKEKGCHQNKSFNLTFPLWLKSELVRHFIRGYFDGDGSAYYHQNSLNITIVSTKQMLEFIKTYLKNEINVNLQLRHEKRCNENTWRLDSGGNLQIKRFGEWLYSESHIFLDKKYQLFNQNQSGALLGSVHLANPRFSPR